MLILCILVFFRVLRDKGIKKCLVLFFVPFSRMELLLVHIVSENSRMFLKLFFSDWASFSFRSISTLTFLFFEFLMLIISPIVSENNPSFYIFLYMLFYYLYYFIENYVKAFMRKIVTVISNVLVYIIILWELF